MRQIKNIFFEKIIKNPFFAGSLIMVVGLNIYNLGQFILHIMVGRILGKAAYGDFAALINIFGIFALVQQALGLTIIKFVSSEKKEQKIAGLIKWAIWWSMIFGALVACLIILFAGNISEFLNISQVESVYVLAPIMLLGAVVGIVRSTLQGLLKFGWYIFSILSEIGLKLILAFLLILIVGWGVVGALVSILLAVGFSLFIAVFTLRKYIFAVLVNRPRASPLIKYSFSVFLQGIALTSMYSIDLFLVKHFFNPTDAGLYAALAKLGGIVFFATSPITSVMFPLVSKRHSQGERYHDIFYLSLLFVGGVAGIVVLLYVLFPSFFLLPLGANFLDGAGILWWFGVFMGLLSITMVFVQFYLSIGKTFIVWLFLFCSALQGLLIYLFHNSLLQVVQMSITTSALLVLCLLIYFPYHDPPSPQASRDKS